jgi:dinuclear metal center YbgI/SA1388 family protein
MPELGEIVALLEEWYPPRHAEDWDGGIGLTCGDPEVDVRRILLALDPVTAVADEAISEDVDLLVVHHPLFYRPTASVAATTPKGRIVHRLVTAGCGLFAAHTNADAPEGGVSDVFAKALGLADLRPLAADPSDPLDKIVVFVPATDAERVRTALTDAGAGAVGDYDACTFTSTGEGRFRPQPGARPTIGEVGALETVDEVRVEAVCDRRLRDRVLAAMRAAHPYEEPAYDVLELAALDAPDRGSGRIGRLPRPETLRQFAARVSGALAPTAHGVRVAGDPDQHVQHVAVVGGAGDGWLDDARAAGVDVYVTSDLRHHLASEFREHDGPALVDVAHWAAESLWLPALRSRLAEALGDTVEVRVSTINTDPWTFRVDQ